MQGIERSRERVALGRVGRAHGVKGAFHFRAFNPDSSLLESLKEIQLGEHGPRSIRRLRWSAGGIILELDGLFDRDQVSPFIGEELWLLRSELPDLPDEAYLHDLVGLKAVGETGEALGRVCGLVEAGPQLLLEIEDGEGTYLVPSEGPFLASIGEESVVLRLPLGFRESQK